MKNVIIILIVGAALTINAYIANAEIVTAVCDFNALPGREFIFRVQPAPLQKYGYSDWKKSPNRFAKGLDYDNYVGKRGKLKESDVSKEDNLKWFVAITETCEVIYMSSIYSPENHWSVYFIDTLERAKSLMGKYIWRKRPFGVVSSRLLFTPDPNVTYPTYHLQKLLVVGVETKQYGHTYGSAPLSLIVETEEGKKALLPYSSRYFYEEYPIAPNWSNHVVELIKDEKVVIGMTKDQVLLSWGNPENINRSVGSWGVHEQWVYEGGTYLYFEDGVLTSYQDSR